MYEIDKARARKILIEEEQFLPQYADRMLKGFPPVRDPLAQAVQQWIEDRTVLDVAIEGLTIQQVMRDQQYHFLVAIKNLNRLLDESLPEEERKKLLNALRTPAVFW